MDFNRVQEIFNSPNKFEIQHNGKPVWITDLHSSTGTVDITDIGSAHTVKDIPVTELSEAGMIR